MKNATPSPASLPPATLLDDEQLLLAKVCAHPRGYTPQTCVERGLLEWLFTLRVVYQTSAADGRVLYRPVVEAAVQR